MNSNARKYVLPLLFVFALSIVLAGGVPRAHAATGPALIVLPATQSNLPAGSTITYQINFANMTTFNGIDISVQTPTVGVISATSIVFSSSTWGFLLTNCVNGVGSGCGATDAPGIAHFAALDTSGFLVGSGNLFNVTYSVQTATGSTGVNVVFDTVSDTSGNPIPHNDFNAVYGGPSGDFGISASSPAAVDVTQSAVSTVSLTSIGGFASAVSLSDTPLPTGLTCGAFSSASVTPPGSATLSCSATVAGSYTVTVTGTSGSLTHSATAVFNFVDFTVSASSPAAVDVTQNAVSTVTVGALNGFAGVVTLSDVVPSGLTCGAITPGSVTGSGTATVSCTSTTAGTFTLPISGTDGVLTRSASAVFTFRDFTVSASAPAAVDATQSAVSTITVTALNGFAGTVTLTDTVPSGITCGAITPGSVTGSGTATLSCSSTTAGTFTVLVSGTDGIITRQSNAVYNFRDFTVSASSPAAVDVTQSAVSTITVGALNGFTGVVTLSDVVPSGLTCGAITPGSVTGSGTATVSCSATVAGAYVLPVSGTDGVLTRSSSATFNFRDFTVAASSPAGVDVTQNAVSTITVGGLNGFAGTVTLSDTVPAGLTCGAISPGTVTGSGTATVSCSATVAGTYVLPVSGTDGVLTRSSSATFNFRDFIVSASSPAAVDVTQSAVSTITVTATNGAPSVTLSDTVPAGLTCAAINPGQVVGSGTASLSCSSTTAGAFVVPISGTDGVLTRTSSATFNFRDFTVSASSPAAVDVTQNAVSTITVGALNGFTGTVTLTDVVPAGLNCGPISPATVTGSGTATVSCTATTAGTFTLPVSGTDGILVRSANPTFTFRDFSVSATSPSGAAGTSIVSTITVTALNGFTGTVTLSDVVPSGLTCGAITPASVSGQGTATVSCSSAVQGTFNLPISGTDGILTRSATAVFTFGPQITFGISASSPAAVDVTQSAVSTITLTSSGGFNSPVALTDTPLPSGLTCGAISPASVTPPGTATLSCSATAAGSYTVTVTGTSGSIVKTATAVYNFRDFTVSASSPAAVDVTQNAASTITVGALNGFAGVVTLSDTPPAGLTCGAITPGTVTGSGTATVSCSATTAGTFTLPVSGTDGIITRASSATFNFRDFTVSASSPAAVDVTQSAVSTITVGALNGFAGVVTLSDTPPAGLTCGAITPGTVTGSGTATVSCSATTAGTFTLPVSGTDGVLTRSSSATFNFRDFTVSATNPTGPAGTSIVSTITVTALNGFARVVTLSDVPPAGLTCGAITPGTVTGSGTATVSCSSPTQGTFNLPISGNDGVLTRSATAVFTFGAPQTFLLTATSPAAVDVTQNAVSTITVTAQNGFSAVVTLTDTPLPSGLTCGAITPGSVTGSGTATVSCSATVAGNYVVTITGTSTSPAITKTATATFSFRDFTVTASVPAPVDVTQSTSTTITVTALNGFAGTVTLSDVPPAGLTCTAISPASVVGAGTATLSCSATAAGTFNVPVSGTDGIITRSATVAFNFRDFTVAASNPSGSAGNSIVSTITVTALNGFARVVTLSDVPPAGLTCGAITPGTVTGSGTATVSCSSPTQGTFNLPISGNDGVLTRSATAVFTFGAQQDFQLTATSPGAVLVTQSAVSTITVTSQNGFAGVVTLTDTPLPGALNCGAITPGSVTGSGTATLSCSATVAGNYVVTITGTSTSPAITKTAMATFSFRDYTVSASPASVTVNAGVTNSAVVVTVTALNGFSGTVTLTTNPSAGLTATVSPTSVTGSGTASLTVSAATAGTYTVTVTGASSPLSHTSGTVTVQVVDFTVTSSAVPTLAPNAIGTSTITVHGLNGYTDTVQLGFVAFGPTASLAPLTVSVTASSSTATSTLSVNAGTAGTYDVDVSGTSSDGTLSHTIHVTVTIVDFSIIASPITVGPLSSGQTGTSNITVTALNGFTGTVNLVSSPSAGLTGTLSASSVTLTSTVHSVVVKLSVSFTTTASYTDAITASMAGFPSRSITVNVISFPTVFISPASQPLVTAGSPVVYNVRVASMPLFVGWDVTVTTNPAVLNPSSISITNSMLAGLFETIDCVNGGAGVPSGMPGNLGCGSTDGPGIVHSQALSIVGQAQGDGILFTINYVAGQPDFTIAASPATIGPLAPNHPGTSTITVNSFGTALTISNDAVVTSDGRAIAHNTVNGSYGSAGGTVTLGPVAFGPSATLSVNTLTFTPTVTSGTSILTVSAGSAGTYDVDITGTNGDGSITHTISITVIVNDFSISATPVNIGFLNPGQNGTSTITVKALNGFTGIVNLSVSAPGFTATLSQTSVTLTSTTTSVNVILTVRFTVSSSYFATVTGSSTGYASHSVQVSLSGFPTIFISPANLPSATPGSTVTFAVRVSSMPLFVGWDVTVTTDPAVLNPQSISLSTSFVAGVFETIDCVNGGAGVPSGQPGNLGCGSTDGPGIVHSQALSIVGQAQGDGILFTISYTVGQPAFTVTASPLTVGPLAPGQTGTSTISVTLTSGFSTPLTISNDAIADSSGNAIAHNTANGNFGPSSVTANLTATPSAGLVASLSSSTLTLNSATGSTGTSTLTVSAATFGNYSVLVSGSVNGSTAQTVTVNVQVVDYTVSANPTSVANLAPGATGTSTITVGALNGFGGTVTLSVASTSGLTCNLSSTTVTGSGTSTLSCSAAVKGTYTATVSGNSPGFPTHTATVTFNVSDFTVIASPATISVSGALSGSTMIVVTGQNGFMGTVSLSVSPSSGLSCTVTPSMVTITTASPGTATLSCNATVFGSYSVDVTGTASGFPSEASHTAHVPVTFSTVGFKLIASQPFFLANSQNGRFKATQVITVTSPTTFSGTVTLTASSSPSQKVSLTFSTTSVTLSAGQSVSVQLFIDMGPHVAAGTYTMTVTGTSGASVQTVQFTVVIPSKSVLMPSITWSPTVSVGSGGSETWTATVQNTGNTAQYVQIVVSGLSSGGSNPFLYQSATVLVPAGATVTISVTAPAGSFNTGEIGQTFNFVARAFFGNTPTTLNNFAQNQPTGSFTVTA